MEIRQNHLAARQGHVTGICKKHKRRVFFPLYSIVYNGRGFKSVETLVSSRGSMCDMPKRDCMTKTLGREHAFLFLLSTTLAIKCLQHGAKRVATLLIDLRATSRPPKRGISWNTIEVYLELYFKTVSLQITILLGKSCCLCSTV